MALSRYVGGLTTRVAGRAKWIRRRQRDGPESTRTDLQVKRRHTNGDHRLELDVGGWTELQRQQPQLLRPAAVDRRHTVRTCARHTRARVRACVGT